MNALGYALLGMLVRKPCTGYELQQSMQSFWQAKHSQIYPLLSKLENDGMVVFEKVEQSGKPDKKIYEITDKGADMLMAWIRKQPATVPIQRDEFLIKIYALWTVDKQTVMRLINERVALYEQRVARRNPEIVLMETERADEISDIWSREFGRYAIFKRRQKLDQEEIEWCRWVKEQIESSPNRAETPSGSAQGL